MTEKDRAKECPGADAGWRILFGFIRPWSRAVQAGRSTALPIWAQRRLAEERQFFPWLTHVLDFESQQRSKFVELVCEVADEGVGNGARGGRLPRRSGRTLSPRRAEGRRGTMTNSACIPRAAEPACASRETSPAQCA